MSVTIKDNIIPTRCPRCNGRWLHESDSHGEYMNCMSCGNHWPITWDSGIFEDHSFIKNQHDEMYRTDKEITLENNTLTTSGSSRRLTLGEIKSILEED